MRNNTYNINAIPTEFNGVTYRSRLEARWAVFFTGLEHLGLKFRYEPEGYTFDNTAYLPDFLVWVDSGTQKEAFPLIDIDREERMPKHYFEIKQEGFKSDKACKFNEALRDEWEKTNPDGQWYDCETLCGDPKTVVTGHFMRWNEKVIIDPFVYAYSFEAKKEKYVETGGNFFCPRCFAFLENPSVLNSDDWQQRWDSQSGPVPRAYQLDMREEIDRSTNKNPQSYWKSSHTTFWICFACDMTTSSFEGPLTGLNNYSRPFYSYKGWMGSNIQTIDQITEMDINLEARQASNYQFGGR